MTTTNVVPMTKRKTPKKPQLVVITPEDATRLLERNKLNRPVSDPKIKRIANQIRSGKWKFNGDTIKISTDDDVADGQNRLWAVIEANMSIETIIVYGIEPDAFATIDTLRSLRSGADILALNGLTHNRRSVSAALAWLIRYQRGAFETGIRRPENKVEVSDIEEAFSNHPNMVDACEKVRRLHNVVLPSILAFVFYIAYSRNPDIADRMIDILENPAGSKTTDPFFVLRAWLLYQKMSEKRSDPVFTVAIIFKALNAAQADREITKLIWRNQGKAAEPFPSLDI